MQLLFHVQPGIILAQRKHDTAIASRKPAIANLFIAEILPDFINQIALQQADWSEVTEEFSVEIGVCLLFGRPDKVARREEAQSDSVLSHGGLACRSAGACG